MLNIRQADVHGVHPLVGEKVFIGRVNTLGFECRRALHVPARHGIKVRSPREMDGGRESSTGNEAGAEKAPVHRHASGPPKARNHGKAVLQCGSLGCLHDGHDVS